MHVFPCFVQATGKYFGIELLASLVIGQLTLVLVLRYAIKNRCKCLGSKEIALSNNNRGQSYANHIEKLIVRMQKKA